MSVDLHWIRTAISSGVSHSGVGRIVSYTPPSGGIPPAGSFNSLLEDIEYPYEHGGTTISVQNPETLDYVTGIENQTCDLIIRNDGSGGTYQDWDTGVSDIKYKLYETFAYAFTGINNFIDISGNCTGTNSYINGSKTVTFYHDGTGGNYSTISAYIYKPYGEGFFSEECWSEEYGNYTTTYISDGNGSYFT